MYDLKQEQVDLLEDLVQEKLEYHRSIIRDYTKEIESMKAEVVGSARDRRRFIFQHQKKIDILAEILAVLEPDK